jgi:hypothetical protein
MTETAAPAASATESSAPSLAESIGEFFGDFSGNGETPEPDESAAETTSAEPASGTADETASETAATADGTTAPPSDGSTPAAATETPVDDDPFTETTPAQYVINGQAIPVEDIRVFKEGGAVIRPESLPNVLSKLAERDTLSSENRTVKQQYETLSKVSEWTGPDNTTVTGPQAAIERIVAHAAVLAENQLLIEHLTDPDKLYSLLTTEQVPDGKDGMRERVILSPAALESLKTQNELRQMKATAAIRDHYGKVVADTSKAQPAPINFDTEAPRLISAIAEQAKLDATVLTPADKALLAKQLPANIRDGLASMAWQELVKDRIQLRAEQKASTQKLVTTTQDATRKAQANMAAAARGLKPAAPKVVATPKAPSPAQIRQQNQGDAYDAMERAAALAVRRKAEG